MMPLQDWHGRTPASSAIALGPLTVNYNTAGVSSGGVTFWTPQVGDVLTVLALRVITPWNGTTPRADAGQGVGVGLWNDSTVSGGAHITDAAVTNCGVVFGDSVGLGFAGNLFVFTTTDPLRFWVTSNGQSNGSDPGASQGQLEVYMAIWRA